MRVIALGVDDDTAEALEEAGADVSRLGDANREALIDAGVEEAEFLILGGAEYSTHAVVAKDVNPDIRTVLVADDAPDYVRGTVDLILSPEFADGDTLVEAVVGEDSEE
ncbi:MAG: CTP synthetase [Halobacteria archaeon]|nr:CTP synthetase [Halobacteria archaeon]